jgi:hypothetical protein
MQPALNTPSFSTLQKYTWRYFGKPRETPVMIIFLEEYNGIITKEPTV